MLKLCDLLLVTFITTCDKLFQFHVDRLRNVGYLKKQISKEMIDRTVDVFNKGNSPVRAAEGTGGTYLMQDSSGLNFVSVFKPMDEEPMAVNIPSTASCVIRRSLYFIRIRGNLRSVSQEVIGFAGVPPTATVRS